MVAWFRTQIERLEPEHVSLTMDGRARVRVCGRALGFVACAGERRWVWGAFDESFQVSAAVVAGPRLAVVAGGLGGRAQRWLSFRPVVDIAAPRAAPRLRRLRWSPYRTPHVTSEHLP
jgi:hypothetical protein